jgi:membrane-bound ClpP family serine protease
MAAMPPDRDAHLSRQDEARRILEVYGDDQFETIMAMLERQFAVLHNRAQVLLALCGVVITTTGFSGRLIAGTSVTAQALIIAGVALVLISAAVVVWGVLHLRWLTMQAGADVRQWLDTALAYRDRKTALYRVAILFMLTGLIVYSGAIAVMLLYPNQHVLPPR